MIRKVIFFRKKTPNNKIILKNLKMSLKKKFIKQIQTKIVLFLYQQKIKKKVINHLINLKFHLYLIHLNSISISLNNKNNLSTLFKKRKTMNIKGKRNLYKGDYQIS